MPHRLKDNPTLVWIRRASLLLAATAIYWGVLYLQPNERLVRTPRVVLEVDNQISVVAFVDSIGPTWGVLFFGAGLFLLHSAYRLRHILVAHSIATGVWTFYGLAVLFGSLFSEPPLPVLTGSVALVWAGLHFIVARTWAGEGVR